LPSFVETRGWREIHAALRNMVDAAGSIRRMMAKKS
jgi:hypothetical protein